MPTNQRSGGFWSGVGRGISRAVRNSPGGHLVHGEFRQAFGATPIGMLVNALRRAGNGGSSAGNGISATGLGQFGPGLGSYAGVPGQSSAPQQDPQWGGGQTTDWGQFVQPDPNMGPPQYSAPTRDPTAVGQPGPNSSTTMGTGAYGNPFAASGAWALGQGANNPLRQSGDSGIGRMRPQQN